MRHRPLGHDSICSVPVRYRVCAGSSFRVAERGGLEPLPREGPPGFESGTSADRQSHSPSAGLWWPGFCPLCTYQETKKAPVFTRAIVCLVYLDLSYDSPKRPETAFAVPVRLMDCRLLILMTLQQRCDWLQPQPTPTTGVNVMRYPLHISGR